MFKIKSILLVPSSWLRTTCHVSVVFVNMLDIAEGWKMYHCAHSVSNVGSWFIPGLIATVWAFSSPMRSCASDIDSSNHSSHCQVPTLFYLFHIPLKSMLIVPFSLSFSQSLMNPLSWPRCIQEALIQARLCNRHVNAFFSGSYCTDSVDVCLHFKTIRSLISWTGCSVGEKRAMDAVCAERRYRHLFMLNSSPK